MARSPKSTRRFAERWGFSFYALLAALSVAGCSVTDKARIARFFERLYWYGFAFTCLSLFATGFGVWLTFRARRASKNTGFWMFLTALMPLGGVIATGFATQFGRSTWLLSQLLTGMTTVLAVLLAFVSSVIHSSPLGTQSTTRKVVLGIYGFLVLVYLLELGRAYA